MRRLIWVLLCVVVFAVGSVSAQSDSPADVLAQANRAYVAEDYATAISLYEQLLADGVRTGAVYFNLGSAHYENDEPGRALAYFLQARQLIPRDTALGRYIARIQGERETVQGDEQVWIDRLGSLSQAGLTTTELAITAFIVWAGWFALVGWMVWRPLARGALRSVLVVWGVILLGVLVMLGSRVYVERWRPQAVAVDGNVRSYSGPAERYLVLYTLDEAAQMRVVERRGAWVRVVLPDSRQGWVTADAIWVVD